MLLQQNDSRGHPVEYLLARIGVRRGGLSKNWLSLAAEEEPLAAVPPGSFLENVAEPTPIGVWQAMLGEYRWLHRQMDDATRRAFLPFFVWLELKTILLCLRNMRGGRSREIARILDVSLLAPRIKQVFSTDSSPGETVERLATTLAMITNVFCGMTQAFAEQGIAGLERRLDDGWFRWVEGRKNHPELADFFGSLVDFHNIRRLYKSMRWGLSEPPPFLAGGRIGRSTLAGIFAGGEQQAMADLLGRLGIELSDPAADPEGELLAMIGRRLRRAGRARRDGYGPIVEYLWRLYMETRNMGILLSAASPDERQQLTRDLLQ